MGLLQKSIEWVEKSDAPPKVKDAILGKLGKFKRPKPRKSLSPDARQKKKAYKEWDLWFGRKVCLRDSFEMDGVRVGICVTCKKLTHWNNFQCGHWIRRENHTIRYDLRNAHGQCDSCNGFRGGMEQEHEAFVREHYGDLLADQFIAIKKKKHQPL
jgi:hypothetical protein